MDYCGLLWTISLTNIPVGTLSLHYGGDAFFTLSLLFASVSHREAVVQCPGLNAARVTAAGAANNAHALKLGVDVRTSF